MIAISNEELFREADKKIKAMIGALEDLMKLLPSAKKVSRSLIESGFTEYKGVVVPLESVSHRYLFDYYETIFLQSFILLLSTMYTERESRLSEFPCRLLLEMGVEESFILFDQSVTPDERKKYILIKILADYSSIETSMQSIFNKWFTKLLKDEQSFIDQQFKEKEKKLLNSLQGVINKSKEDEYTRLLINVRQLCMKTKSSIVSSHVKKGHISITTGFKRMKSGEAHTIHGNVFLLLNRLQQQSRDNHLFRLYMYVLFAGQETIMRLIEHISDPKVNKKFEPVLAELTSFKSSMAPAWAASSKIKSA
ncbi:MAG: hypothetical protein HZA34_04880 [Candidatus Pacebacteria bacterium]|nr:hypothetical protein [Candidatus Paceibacterota bacterium]